MNLQAKTKVLDLFDPAVHGSVYLYALASFDLEPNFWCSQEYFKRAGFRENIIDDRYLQVIDTSDLTILPLIDIEHGKLHGIVPDGGIWADMPDFLPLLEIDITSSRNEFLDYEYIYDPESFCNMEGKQWATFRKNCRKFARRHSYMLNYVPIEEISYWSKFDFQMLELFEEWTDGVAEDEIADGRVLANYFQNGKNRMVLVDSQLKILGMNIWDENWKYLNFRYCICRNIPFLSEYMRFLFYQSAVSSERVRPTGARIKLVNDGGVLDRPSLKAFKDKMNPIEKRLIYSWKKEKPNGQT